LASKNDADGFGKGLHLAGKVLAREISVKIPDIL